MSDSDSDSGELVYKTPESSAATKQKHRAGLNMWKEFMSKRGVSEEESLQRHRPIPRAKLLGKFLDYYVNRPRRPNSEQISVVGVESFYGSFAAAYQQVTDTRFDKGDNVKVYGYIRHGLPDKFGVRKNPKEKYEVTETDLDNLTATLWRNNDCSFNHERMRVQLALLLLLHAYSGARAGTFIESGYYYKNSGRCLTYKDIRVHVFYHEDGRPGWMLELTQRYTKTNPDPAHNTLRVIMKDKDELLRDPVFFFVALAFADNAFRGISSLDQFWNVRPSGDNKQLEFQWNDAVMDIPVFRSIDKGGSIGIDSPAWNTASMYRSLNSLTATAGYRKGTITIHTLRRGFGNRVQPHVTTTELSQALGHTSRKMYEQKYQSRISSIDGQALFLGGTPNVRPIEHLRSAARHRNIDLPQKLRAQEFADFEDSQEMTALRSRLAALSSSKEWNERKKIGDIQLRLKKQALKRYQDQWLQEDYDRLVSTASVDCKRRSSAEAEVDDLRSFFPERVRIAEMTGTLMPFLDEKRKSALEGLIVLCNQDSQRIFYRPGEHPVDGRCPVSSCGMLLMMQRHHLSNHIHSCRRREMLSASPSAQFCYRCCKWCPTLDDWGKHCEWHLNNLSTRCEIYTYRNTLLTPGICPFCVGFQDIPPGERFCQWTSSASLWDHVSGHLAGVSWPMSCPHPLCNIEVADRELLDHHLIDTHGKNFHAKETLKRKYDEQDEQMEYKEMMPSFDRKNERANPAKKRTRPGQNVFRLTDAVGSISTRLGVIAPITSSSLSRTARSSSCPPIGTHSAMTLDKPIIEKHTESETPTSSTTSSKSPSSQATIVSYCGIDYAVTDGLNGSGLDSTRRAESHDAIDGNLLDGSAL